MGGLKIRSKLLISFLLLSALSTGAVTYSIYSEMRPHFLEAVEVTLIDTSRLLASQLAVEAERTSNRALDTQTVRRAAEKLLVTRFPRRNVYDSANQSQLRIYVTDSKGVVVFDSKQGEFEGQDFSRWRDIHLSLKGQYGARATRLNPNDPNTSTHFVAAPIQSGSEILGVVSVGKSVDSVAGFLQGSRLRIVASFLMSLALALLLSVIAAYWISRPVLDLSHWVRSLSTPSPETFPRLSTDEIGSLGGAFETLRKELEGKQYVERYVHNLTHEIKAPLTGIVGAAELLDDASLGAQDRSKLLSNIRSEARRLQDIAEKLLELASIEARERKIRAETFDLRLLLEEVVDGFEIQARSYGLMLKLDADENLSVTGERFLIWRAAANLVQNAIEFSPDGGEIVLLAKKTGAEVSIEVDDKGPGLPDYAVSRATEKFFSLERPRTGKKSSGLGLSFVSEVMRLHRGRLTLENRPGQQGTRARLSWPASPSGFA